MEVNTGDSEGDDKNVMSKCSMLDTILGKESRGLATHSNS